MKQFKILFAFLIVIGLGFTVNALHNSINFSKKSNTEAENTLIRGAGQYRYTSTSDDPSALQLPGNWVAGGEGEPECGNEEEIPCYVNYTGSDFDAFLSTATLNTLLGISVETKAISE